MGRVLERTAVERAPPRRPRAGRRAGDRLTDAIAALPVAQRTVLELRDVQGFSAAEVCELLDISEANQRVLLHRGRSKARALLERYLDDRAGVS